MQGSVKWFSEAKGFGSITGDDGQDVFLHTSEVEGFLPHAGDRVTYTAVQRPKGPAAQRVHIIHEGAHQP